MTDVKLDDSTPAQLLSTETPPASPSLGEWRSQGLCVGSDPDVFFPSHGDPGAQARQICAACIVRNDCLGYAIGADEIGIWGGLDQDERRNLRRRQRRKDAAVCGKTGQSERAA